MKQTVYACDRCKRQIPNQRIELCITVPHARVVAEDDTTESDTMDLCAPCSQILLGAFIKKIPIEQRADWLKALRKNGEV